MYRNNTKLNIDMLLRRPPQVWAVVRGSEAFPNIIGTVRFYQTLRGSLTVSEIHNLPTSGNVCQSPVFAFHIHEGSSCAGEGEEPFPNVGMHYNPHSLPHPCHSGDMPPLFSANGYAFSAFITDRFTVNEIIGKTVIIHSDPDDFTSQPSGNPGIKIACGEIVTLRR